MYRYSTLQYNISVKDLIQLLCYCMVVLLICKCIRLHILFRIEPCGQEVGAGVSWPFKLICALQDRDRTYYFSAPSEKDLKVFHI